MRNILLVLASAATLAMTVPSSAQVYVQPAGVGTVSGGPNNDDGRWRNNNWRDGKSDDWRRNNWREDRTDDWRRHNWREDRTNDWRPREEKNNVKESRRKRQPEE